MAGKTKNYTEDLKKQIVALKTNGKATAEIAKEYGIAKSTIIKWVNDYSKSIDGLTAIVQIRFKLDPFSNSLFIFCNKSRDKIKILQWEHSGFWLYYKRLENGKFNWPTNPVLPVISLKILALCHGEYPAISAISFLEDYFQYNLAFSEQIFLCPPLSFFPPPMLKVYIIREYDS